MRSFASSSGWRKFGVVTRGPNRMVDVDTLTAAKSGTIDIHVFSRNDRHERWSYV
jgi:hypothetical protein